MEIFPTNFHQTPTASHFTNSTRKNFPPTIVNSLRLFRGPKFICTHSKWNFSSSWCCSKSVHQLHSTRAVRRRVCQTWNQPHGQQRVSCAKIVLENCPSAAVLCGVYRNCCSCWCGGSGWNSTGESLSPPPPGRKTSPTMFSTLFNDVLVVGTAKGGVFSVIVYC